MNKYETLDILKKIRDGDISPEDALMKLCTSPFEDLGYAKLDHHRELRQGVSEVIYGAGKTPEQIIGIVTAMREKGQRLVLITRLSQDAYDIISKDIINKNIINNDTVNNDIINKDTINKDIPTIQYNKAARICIIGDIPRPSGIGKIVVASGGTSDMPVAEEAAVTAEALGNEVVRVYDVGVAGLHRLLSRVDTIMGAQVIIAVAGMEGALASVVGGLSDCPVIGVPTSVGYGASFGGVSALLTMLNSCASGVSVVNIDNGFGAGYLAHMINHPKSKCQLTL